MERTQTIAADLYKTLKETPVFESFKDVRDDKNFIKAEFTHIIQIFTVSKMAKLCNLVYKERLVATKMHKGEIKYDLFDKTAPTVSSDAEIGSFLRIYGSETVGFSSDAISEYENIFKFRNKEELYKPVKNGHSLQDSNKKSPKTLTKELEDGADYPCIVIAASGMCDKGTVLECLKLWLPDPDATVLLTGYTSPGSNGDILKRLMRGEFSEEEKYNIEMELGDSTIRLMKIQCRILDMSPYYSGHADRDQLLKYVFDNPIQIRTKPVQVFLNHGNVDGMESIAACIDERNQRLAEALGIADAPKTVIPKKDDTNRW